MSTLVIGLDEVVLRAGGEVARHRHDGPDDRLRELVRRLASRPSAAVARELGELLGHRFLGGAIGSALTRERGGLAVEADGEELADLPWEAAIPPGWAVPLAERLDVCRAVAVPAAAAGPRPSGPLRILAVIGSPDADGGELLDHERELARILDSVDPGRRRRAGVRVLEWGSTAAIAAALVAEPCDVLHLSCHGRPGYLLLETPSGEPDHVDAARFLAEALPPGAPVPLVVLTGCATALATPFDPAGLGRRLVRAGIPAVLAMRGQVGDHYAIALCGALYERLAAGLDPRAAVSAARRELAGEAAEWVAPVLFLANGNPPVLVPGVVGGPPAGGDGSTEPSGAPGSQGTPGNENSPPAEPHQPAGALGWRDRPPGYLVGRRAAIRRLGREPRGVLLYGIGGVGKTSLAGELASRAERDGAVVVALTGQVAVDAIVDETRASLSRYCTRNGLAADHPARRAVTGLSRPGCTGAEAVGLVGECGLPVLLVLDNAEDDLESFSDGELPEFLAGWLRRGRVVLTSRVPFEIAGLPAYQVGPLNWPETRKLCWRLPGLAVLPAASQRVAWQQLGGHPRALEYLDALLREGDARFADVSARLAAARDRLPVDFAGAVAEAGALIADDVLLPELLARLDGEPLARRLLLGASVYRNPVDRTGLAWQVAQLREANSPEHSEIPPLTVPSGLDAAISALARLGLLAPAEGGQLVHPVTRGALHRGVAPGELAEAHLRAAGYWMWRLRLRGADDPVDVGMLIEAVHHYFAGGNLAEAAEIVELTVGELDTRGRWAWAEQLGTQAREWVPESEIAAVLTLSLASVRHMRGDSDGAEQFAADALQRFERLGQRENVAAARHQLGIIAHQRGEYRRAGQLYRQGLATYEELGDGNGIGTACHQLAQLAEQEGDTALAEQYLERSLAGAREADDLSGVARATHELGRFAASRGDYVKAESCYLAARNGFARLGDRGLVANTEIVLAAIARRQWRFDRAGERLRSALDVFEEIGAADRAAECHLSLGKLARDRQDYPWAETCLVTAAGLLDEAGAWLLAAEVLGLLGEVRTLGGNLPSAVLATTEALARFETAGEPPRNLDLWHAIQYAGLGEAAFSELVCQALGAEEGQYTVENAGQVLAMSSVAGLYHSLGMDAAEREPGAAWGYFHAALLGYEADGNLPGVVHTQEQLGVIAMEQGELDHAERYLTRSLAGHEQLGDPGNVAIGHHLLGLLLQRRRSWAAADEHLSVSIAIKQRIGDRAGESNSRFHLGRSAEDQGELDRAEEIYYECLAADMAAGDRAGQAVTEAQIGIVLGKRGLAGESVPWLVRALLVHLELGSRQAARQLTVLRERRRALGEAGFRAKLEECADGAAAEQVLRHTELLPGTEVVDA